MRHRRSIKRRVSTTRWNIRLPDNRFKGLGHIKSRLALPKRLFKGVDYNPNFLIAFQRSLA